MSVCLIHSAKVRCFFSVSLCAHLASSHIHACYWVTGSIKRLTHTHTRVTLALRSSRCQGGMTGPLSLLFKELPQHYPSFLERVGKVRGHRQRWRPHHSEHSDLLPPAQHQGRSSFGVSTEKREGRGEKRLRAPNPPHADTHAHFSNLQQHNVRLVRLS